MLIVFVVHFLDTSSVVQPAYSSVLTENSPMYFRECKLSKYYYQSIQVNVDESGSYSISSGSDIDTYGYIYKDKFNPYNPSENLISSDGHGCSFGKFKLTIDLQVTTKYILVVTTWDPEVTGALGIFASGSKNVTFKHISEYLVYLLNDRQRCTKYRTCS